MRVDKTKWQRKTFKDVCSIIHGKDHKSVNTPNGDYPIYGSGGVMGRASKYICEAGTTIIGRKGTINSPIFVDEKFWNIDTAFGLSPKDGISNKFFYYFCVNFDFTTIQSGAAIPSLTQKDISKQLFILPPIDEQRGIAAELDAVQEMIDGYKAQLAELDTLAQSIFLETFGDPISNPKGWEIQAIKKVTDSHISNKPVEKINGKVWALNLDKIEAQSGQIISYDFIDEEEIGPSTFPFDDSMVLYSKLRPYLNKVVAPIKSGYATTELVPFIPHTNLNKIFFLFLLRNKSTVKILNATSGGSRMPRTKMDAIRNLNIILPPISLQQQFAEQIEAIEKQKELLRQQIADAETLMAERMQYYFS